MTKVSDDDLLQAIKTEDTVYNALSQVGMDIETCDWNRLFNLVKRTNPYPSGYSDGKHREIIDNPSFRKFCWNFGECAIRLRVPYSEIR